MPHPATPRRSWQFPAFDFSQSPALTQATVGVVVASLPVQMHPHEDTCEFFAEADTRAKLIDQLTSLYRNTAALSRCAFADRR